MATKLGKVVVLAVAPLRTPAKPGPSRKDGRPNDVVFVIVGVTLAIVANCERIIVGWRGSD